MKILITYGTDLQIAIISGLLDCLKRNGIDAIAWNRFTFGCMTNNDAAFKENLRFFAQLTKVQRYIRGLLYYVPFFVSIFTKRAFKGIDVINYHSQDKLCDIFIPYIKKNDKRLIISIWGSDLYRITEDIREKRQQLYEYVDLIHVESPAVKNDFLKKYQIDESKVVYCNFGVDLLDEIDAFREKREAIKQEMLPEEACGRIVITCGYNARKGQQHTLMINQLLRLPDEYKKKIFIVFPLTYTVQGDDFLGEIDSALNEFDIPYCCFREHLDKDHLAKLRLLSDAVINTQVSDSLSTSLVEYFYSGNIMLLGDWLPYQFLKEEYQIDYIPITTDDIAEKVCYMLDNYEAESERAYKNIAKTYSLASWEGLTPRFGEMFKKAYKY